MLFIIGQKVLTYSSTLICLSFLDVNSGVPLFKIRQVTSPTLALKLKKKSMLRMDVKLSSYTTFSEHIGEKVASMKTKIR